MKTIAGNKVNIWLRSNAVGGDFKRLVCIEDLQYSLNNEVNTRLTNCGPSTNVSDATFTASGTAVQNLDLDADTISYNELKAWQKAKTKLDMMFYNDADSANGIAEGEAIDEIGSAFITATEYSVSAGADGQGSFTFQLTGTGTVGEYDESGS
jgi:hypothetical protein